MSREEFRMLIESMEFKVDDSNIYSYKGEMVCKIYLYYDFYNFLNESKWSNHEYDDLTPLLKFLRSIKLKALLNEPRLI